MSNFSVDYWGSDPDEGNDDHWTGTDFETEEEARKAFNGPIPRCAGETDTAYVTLSRMEGSTIEEIDKRKNPKFRPEKEGSDSEWDSEMRNQYAMGTGRSWDESEEYDPAIHDPEY